MVSYVGNNAQCPTDEGRSKVMNSVKVNQVKYSLFQSDDRPNPILLDTKF